MLARTPEQKQALRDAYRLLSAQFDHVLLVSAMRDDHETEMATDMDVYWKGGWVGAQVLIHLAKNRLDYQKRPKCEPL